MPKLSVCVEMFWTDLPYPERIRRVAALGYQAYEFWGWRSKDLDAIRAAQEETGLHLAGILAEPPMSLTTPGNDRELVQGMVESVQAARSLGCTGLIVTTGNVIPGESYEITRRRAVRKLKAMAQAAADGGAAIFLEPLNPFVDHPGYWLTTMAQAADIVEEVDSPALTILYDMYHQQITEGNLIANLHRHLSHIGHIHTAGVPGRHELVGSENDWVALFRAVDEAGYQGYVGLEFRPSMGEEAALQQCLDLAHTQG